MTDGGQKIVERLELMYIRVNLNVCFQSIPVLAHMVEGTRRLWKYPSPTSQYLHFMNAVPAFQPRAVLTIQLFYPGSSGASNQILQIAKKYNKRVEQFIQRFRIEINHMGS